MHISTLRRRRPLAGAAVVLAALVAALLFPVQPSQALILANHVEIIRVGTPPPDTEGAREFQVVAGQGNDVVVQSQDFLFNPSPISLVSDKTIRLTTTGPDAATFSYTATLPAGASSVTFKNVKWPTPYDGVVLTATVTDGSASPDSATGNVTASGATVPASTPFWGYDGSSASTTGCSATAQKPICVELTTHGATTDQLLAFSPCDGTEGCVLDSKIWTWLVGTDSSVTATNPNKMRIKLDKTIAGQRGVSSFTIKLQLVPDGPFVTVGACDSGNIVPPGENHCRGASFSDNAGDRIFDVYYIDDGRGIIG